MIAKKKDSKWKLHLPIRWSGYLLTAFVAGGFGSFAADGPPVITLQPSNVNSKQGERADFIVQVDGSVPMTITWLRNGLPLASGSSITFSLPSLRTDDDGTVVSVVASNSLGVSLSSSAIVTVEPGIAVVAAANHTARTGLYRGWPMILEVSLVHPEAFESNATPFVIRGTNGLWFTSLQVEIRDSADQLQAWWLHSAALTNDSVEISSESGARMLWWFTPDETRSLPVGDFRITAILNTTNVAQPDAWKGVLRGVPIHLFITNEPPQLDEVLECQKRRLFADYARLQGDPTGAQSQIDALLAAYPTNIGGLTYRAYLKRTAGKFDDALQSVEQGLEQVTLQSPDASEPPSELLLLESQLSEIVAPPVLKPNRVGGHVEISWDGFPALFSYQLETSLDLGNWSVIATNLSAVSNTYSFSFVPTDNARFVRVRRSSILSN